MATLDNLLAQESLTGIRLQYTPPREVGGRSITLENWKDGDLPSIAEIESVAEAHGDPGRYRVLSYRSGGTGLTHQWTVTGSGLDVEDRIGSQESKGIDRSDKLWRAQDHSALAAQVVAMGQVNSALVVKIHEADARERASARVTLEKLLREIGSLREQAARGDVDPDSWVHVATGAMEALQESPQLAAMVASGAQNIAARFKRTPPASPTNPPSPGSPSSQGAPPGAANPGNA